MSERVINSTLPATKITPLLTRFRNATLKKGTTAILDYFIYSHDDGRRFIIADCDPSYSFLDGGVVQAYELHPATDHVELLNSKPSELEPLRRRYGRFHGKLIKIIDDNSYAILIGPPAEMIVPAYKSEKHTPPPAAPPSTNIRNAFMS